MKLFTPFYQADIIIASPLGLRLLTGADGERQREYDFLSSIDICVLDRADALRMQNWDHVLELSNCMNRKPRQLRDVDIRRLLPSAADQSTRFLRQTIILSNGHSPDYPALLHDRVATEFEKGQRRSGDGGDSDDDADAGMTRFDTPEFEARNVRGCVRFADKYAGDALASVTAHGVSRQMFQHVELESLSQHHKSLVDTFTKRFWPDVGTKLEQLLIVVGSGYGDFLKVRRFLKSEGVDFCALHEYSSIQSLSRNRMRFFKKQVRVMVTTERFLWFRRYKLRGARHCVFVGTPETPEIYSECCNNLFNRETATALTLLKKHLANKIFGYLARCDFWAK